jgi:hypothetical protein
MQGEGVVVEASRGRSNWLPGQSGLARRDRIGAVLLHPHTKMLETGLRSRGRTTHRLYTRRSRSTIASICFNLTRSCGICLSASASIGSIVFANPRSNQTPPILRLQAINKLPKHQSCLKTTCHSRSYDHENFLKTPAIIPSIERYRMVHSSVLLEALLR